ncbi:flagellar basal body rod protein FlgC [Thermosulfuriphilus ammonigenes]|uniref:Flagellar basal-body rod protein FlgC n=1 Tax=Thermosulfuriphilus ammonigenes TaxID=1936021 RepID=A0A6G7PY67_9BACT|nr:flagellar basal body rod protein FlgC [Thermosulfuriphilus ammonigenes]MBA2849818.1 flagellar basal-body rod protein FlgC [Thermosulfuriphilus ammonigenes]QIJ72634.1 flagellar basal body rod protein FlgC [Thermosulfuriphilus ammonigenes]
MKLLTALKLAADGMAAQRVRLNITSMNLANASTTRTLEGGPYRAKSVVFVAKPLKDFASSLDEALETVQVKEVVDDPSPFKEVYDPGHPDADERGIVLYPNVNVMEEMVDMLSAAGAYQANLTVISITKSMALKALDIVR